MIIVMRHDATPKQIAEVVTRVEARGLRVNISAGEEPMIPIERKKEKKTRASQAAQLAQKIAGEIDASDVDSLTFTDEDLPSPDLLTPPPPRSSASATGSLNRSTASRPCAAARPWQTSTAVRLAPPAASMGAIVSRFAGLP